MGCFDSKVEPRNEPVAVRSCTDVFWLILYVSFCLLMVLIAVFSIVYGDPVRIINGYDSFGNTCGSKNTKIVGAQNFSGMDTTDKRYLFFMDIKELKRSLKICVKKCPDRRLESINDLAKFYEQTGTNLCNYNFSFSGIPPQIKEKALSSSYGPCPVFPVYESTSVLHRCVPKPVKEVAEHILQNFYGLLNSWDTLEQVMSDLYNSWRYILYLTLFSLLISLFTVSILHLLAHLVSYIVMILVSIACICASVYLWLTYYDIKNNLDRVPKSMLLLESVRNETAFFWYSIIATVFTVIIVTIILFMRKRVDFLAELFEQTSACLASIPTLFLQPIFTFAVLLGFFAFWIFVILCLATSYYPGTHAYSMLLDATVNANNSTTSVTVPIKNLATNDTKKFTVIEFVDPAWVKYMWWVYFIGLIWTSEFIMGCQSMVIAGSVAHWYYRKNYKDNDHVTFAINKLVKYHMGSVAKGSLLITMFKIPRIIMTYLYAKLKKSGSEGNECANCFLKCCICCFYCVEKFIRYLNHNAYTIIAIDGVSFCTAAGTAFSILASNGLRVATKDGIGDFILFLGKCFTAAVTGTVGLYLFKRNEELKFYAVPTLLVCIFAFFVAHCILSLYEMVLDTLFLCKCQEGEQDNAQVENMRLETVPPTKDSGELESMK